MTSLVLVTGKDCSACVVSIIWRGHSLGKTYSAFAFVLRATMPEILGLCLLFLFLSVPLAIQDDTRTEDLLSRTLWSLEKLADYYELNMHLMNLDGVFGARLAAGPLKSFLNNVDINTSDPQLMADLEQIQKLQERFQKINLKGVDYVKENEPEYFKNMGFINKDGKWEMFYPQRTTDPSLKNPISIDPDDGINEDISDDCISELIRKNCVISGYCWTMMTQPGYRGYSITHQLLYIIIGLDYGCEKEVESKAKDAYNITADQMQASFCSNIMKESKDIARNDFPFFERDIFLEQVAVCGMVGYSDFFRKDWLENILSWQLNNGCFAFHPEKHDRSISNVKRNKRENWDIADGCASHATAVGTAALAQYVRFLFEDILNLTTAT